MPDSQPAKRQYTKRKTEEKDKSVMAVSLVTPDHLIETIYDPQLDMTSYAVFVRQTGKCERHDQFIYKSTTYVPPDRNNPLVKKGFVLLASRPRPLMETATLLEEIRKFVSDYLTVSPEFEEIIPYFVLLTWIYDRFDTVPYLRALGDMGRGKSRLLFVMTALSYKAFLANGAATVSPIFRILDSWHPTLILDEADFNRADEKSEIMKIFNSGFAKNTPVLRSEDDGKGGFTVRAFDVYGPKIFASRHQFGDDALESRCFTHDMDMIERTSNVPINLDDNFRQRGLELRNKLLTWRFHNFGKIEINPKLTDPRVTDRLNQISLPLKSIALAEEARKKIEGVIYSLHLDMIDSRGLSWDAGVLHAIITQITGLIDPEEITVKMIAEEYNKEADDKDKLTNNKVGWILRKKLKIKTVRRGAGFTLVYDDATKQRLEQLKLKYGLT